MFEVTVIGNGNVGTQLAMNIDALKDFKLKEWFGRSWKNKKIPKNGIDKIENLKDADLFIIAVSDSSIQNISKLINKNHFLVHCSGATSINVFNNHKRSGVLFPVQSITKDKNNIFEKTPFCIEAKKENDLNLLKKLVLSLKGRYKCLNSTERANVHLSAVWINNFVNHIIYKGKKICDENNVPYSIIKPLLKNTINQVLTNDPFIIQTGPARREDEITLKNHLNLMNNTDDKSLYLAITKSIKKSYE
tara:strand:+ start:1179 stop:1922 length:744 start_codon:yes stop_codon:yes gene_type:complete